MNSIYEEEVAELLEKLESSLLLLEITPNDNELIEDVFRSMHTIKGSSGMFGYENVALFVHNLESIYDSIRAGKLTVTKTLIGVTLISLDHIKRIVLDIELKDTLNKELQISLTAQILALMGEHVTTESPVDVERTQEIRRGVSTYYISFIPNTTIFDNGTNPLLILEELFDLGDCEIYPRLIKIDKIEDFDPLKCTSYWEILLATSVAENEIRDVFLFVEGDSTLRVEKLCAYNLLADLEVKNKIESFVAIGDDAQFNLEELKSLISDEQQVVAEEIATQLPENKVETVAKKQVKNIRVASDKLNELMSIVSELVTTQASLSLYTETKSTPELEIITENVEKLSRQLRDTAFGMTLIPIKHIMSRFQRLVRDVSLDLGKTIDFKIEGDETELDKNIIEGLTDPLMHILRNSLDHGIESAEDRREKGKPAIGTILFKAFYSGANVHIQIQDDGKGIDVNQIRAKAIQNGLMTDDEYLTDKKILDFIFFPGFSTAKKLTDVSGRGVGMDVVRRNINDLRGTVDIRSEVGEGTTLTIKLPLTLSIIDGLLVEIGSSNYVVPLGVVDKCYEVAYSKLEDNFNKILLLDDVEIPFLNLREELLIDEEKPELTQIIVVNNGARKAAISVDLIVGEYQAVLKPIGSYYKKQDYLSGATILGDGTIALVLDTNKIISNFSNG
jgi:two-component system chemotaxis sensor kinase CheA